MRIEAVFSFFPGKGDNGRVSNAIKTFGSRWRFVLNVHHIAFYDVIIDEVDDEGAVARSQTDAPEIDGVVYLNEETKHQPGDIVTVKVHASDEHDLWANSF